MSSLGCRSTPHPARISATAKLVRRIERRCIVTLFGATMLGPRRGERIRLKHRASQTLKALRASLLLGVRFVSLLGLDLNPYVKRLKDGLVC